MKKFFFIFVLLLAGLFCFSTASLASMFPNDAKTAYTYTTTGGLSTCTDLLSATTTPRTILYASIRTGGANTAHIRFSDGTTWVHSFGLNGFFEAPVPKVITNLSITCDRESGFANYYRVVYVDYDLTLVSDNPTINITGGTASTTIGTIGTTTMPINIENIGYIATTTQLGNGQTFTQAIYNLPFNLFIFMAVLFFAIMLVVVLSIYFIKTKKNDY